MEAQEASSAPTPSQSYLEWLAEQPEAFRLQTLIRDHSAPAYGYPYRSLSASSGMEALCRCGTWFPAYTPERHIAEALLAAGVRLP